MKRHLLVAATILTAPLAVHAQPTSLFPAASAPNTGNLLGCSQPVSGKPGHYTSVKCSPAQVLQSGGAFQVDSIAALRAGSWTTVDALTVKGYYGPGTPGGGAFVRNPAETAADNGGSVIVDAAGNHFDRLGGAPQSSNWGDSGSDSTTTGNCSGTSLTLGAALDFANGEPISVAGCGIASTVAAPSAGPTLTPQGQTTSGGAQTGSGVLLSGGSGYANGDTVTLTNGAVVRNTSPSSGAITSWTQTTAPTSAVTGTVTQSSTSGSGSGATFQFLVATCYKVFAIDSNFGFSAAGPEVCTTNTGAAGGTAQGSAALSLASSTQLAQDTLVAWSASSGTTPISYGVCSGSTGAETLRTVVAANAPDGLIWYDYGQSAEAIPWIGTTCPAAAQADILRTTIASGAGSTSITLASAATTSASGGLVEHDDTGPLQSALAGQAVNKISNGTHHVHGPLVLGNLGDGSSLSPDAFSGATLKFSGAGYDGLTLVGTGGGSNNLAVFGLNIDGSGMASGFCVGWNNTNHPTFWVTLNSCYNEMYMTNVYTGKPQVQSRTRRRGDYGLYAYASTTATQTGVLALDWYNSASSYRARSVYFSGCVANIQGDHVGIQRAAAPEFALDNLQNCSSGGPQYIKLKHLGLNGVFSVASSPVAVTGAVALNGLVELTVASTVNFKWGGEVIVSGVTGTTEANGTHHYAIVDSTHLQETDATFANAYISGGTVNYYAPGGSVLAGVDNTFTEPYWQYVGPPGTGDTFYVGSAARMTKIVAGQCFGAGNSCLSVDGFDTDVEGFSPYSNTLASIDCGPLANRLTVIGGSDFNDITGSPVSASTYGIWLEKGCLNATIKGANGWIGQHAGIYDQTLHGANTLIDDRGPGSPNTIILATAGSQTLTCAAYPNLYNATDGRVQEVDVWNYSSAVTLTLDTLSNMVTCSPAADQITGRRAHIRFVSHRNFNNTLAVGASGSLVGSATIPASGLTNGQSSFDVYLSFTGSSSSTTPTGYTAFTCSPTGTMC